MSRLFRICSADLYLNARYDAAWTKYILNFANANFIDHFFSLLPVTRLLGHEVLKQHQHSTDVLFQQYVVYSIIRRDLAFQNHCENINQSCVIQIENCFFFFKTIPNI